MLNFAEVVHKLDASIQKTFERERGEREEEGERGGERGEGERAGDSLRLLIPLYATCIKESFFKNFFIFSDKSGIKGIVKNLLILSLLLFVDLSIGVLP